MHIIGIVFFALIALFWLTYGLQTAFGAMKLPWLKSFKPAADADCPRISLILAARNEEEKLPAALATLVAIDYPNLEIIAVDDRSHDATSRILDDFAYTHDRLKVVHVKDLPPGWLGKPHALQKAYESSTGEWLLFTDADVQFRPDTLRRCVTILRTLKFDHLTLFGDVEMVGFWEKVLITFFGMSFSLATQPHQVSNPHSRAYVGVGAFQMVKRTAYEACGAHRRIAMEVIDDVKLGKMIKLGGFRSGVAVAENAVSVRWHAGLFNLVRGLEKNFFAAAQFQMSQVLLQIFSLIIFYVAPSFGLLFGHGWVRILAAVGVLIPFAFLFGVDIVMRVSPLYSATFPLAATIFIYMLLRSTIVTIKQGGIYWRGTFYPLDDLRRNTT
ncbi:MAG TPA: glycosyltransferase [Candidatus Acidoferrum sp.]|jgi:cellulose synthase/poly-beta-1,6-N-acetylglucosamine synthase-like glycosyltransferase